MSKEVDERCDENEKADGEDDDWRGIVAGHWPVIDTFPPVIDTFPAVMETREGVCVKGEVNGANDAV